MFQLNRNTTPCRITYSGGERVPQHELLACAQCGCFAFSCFEDFAIRLSYRQNSARDLRCALNGAQAPLLQRDAYTSPTVNSASTVGFASGAARRGQSRGRDTDLEWSRSSSRPMDRLHDYREAPPSMGRRTLSQSIQILRHSTQNSRSTFESRGRFTERRRTASCCRRATFSRASSRPALKAETRARTNDKIMPAWCRQTGD